MKKIVLSIQIINIIFFVFIYTIAISQGNTMKFNHSLTPFYILSTLAFSLIMMGASAAIVLKTKMQDKYLFITGLNFFGSILLCYFACMIDYRTDKINFSPNAVKTTAEITSIEKKK